MENLKSNIEDEALISLNQNLFNEFSIEELEDRFETDPLLLNNLFNIGFSADGEGLELFCACNKISNCPDLVCGCNGGWSDSCACDNIKNCPELTCGCDAGYKR